MKKGSNFRVKTQPWQLNIMDPKLHAVAIRVRSSSSAVSSRELARTSMKMVLFNGELEKLYRLNLHSCAYSSFGTWKHRHEGHVCFRL